MSIGVEDSTLVRCFDAMLKKAKSKERNEPVDIFEGWTDEKKVSFMKQLCTELPEATQAPPLEAPPGLKCIKVPDSVLCDISEDDTAQRNFKSAVGHYLSWQYTESDFRVEFGSDRRRSFITRPFGTFVFYFRYQEFVVGLVVDGQRGYVEGCITQIYRDGIVIQENVLQFRRSAKEKDTDYIKSKRTHTLKFSGNYTEGLNVSNVDLSLYILRKAIKKVAKFRPKIDRKEPSPVWFEVLILYAAEAPRIRGVMEPAARSLDPKIKETVGVLRIPYSEEAFVLNYKQLSFSALDCIKRKKFSRVSGTTPRNLFEILSSVLLLRRTKTYPTKFLLPDAPHEGPEKPLQGERGQQLSKQKRLQLLNEKGSKYSPLIDEGVDAFQSEPWILNLWEDTFNKDWDKKWTMEGEAGSVLEEVFLNGLSSWFHKICPHTFSRKAVPENPSSCLSKSVVLRDSVNNYKGKGISEMLESWLSPCHVPQIYSHDTSSRAAISESPAEADMTPITFTDLSKSLVLRDGGNNKGKGISKGNLPTCDPPRSSSPPGYIKMPGRPKAERREAGAGECTKLLEVGNKATFSLCHDNDHSTNAKRKQIAIHEHIGRVTARKRERDEASSASQNKKPKAALQVDTGQLGANVTSLNITIGFDYQPMPNAVVQIVA